MSHGHNNDNPQATLIVFARCKHCGEVRVAMLDADNMVLAEVAMDFDGLKSLGVSIFNTIEVVEAAEAAEQQEVRH